MKRFEKTKTSPIISIAIPVSTAVVFLADLLMPLGFAVWIFYLVPLLLSLRMWRPRIPLIVAAFVLSFIIAGYLAGRFASPTASSFSARVAEVNRFFGIVVLLAVAVVARQFIVTKLNLRERDWVQAGQRDLSVQMRGELQPSQLGDHILGFLCRYLDAPVASFYAAEQDGRFHRIATHGASAAAAAPTVVAPGETLVGQAIKDRRMLRFDDLPGNYLPIASTLGQTGSQHVVIVPTIVEGAVNAVVELGFLHAVSNSDMDLLQTIAEPIAIALRSAQYRRRQAELLAETQRQAEELQAQQETLREANEELEEHSRALKDSQTQLEAKQAELEQTNAQLEDQTQVLEHQRDELSRIHVDLVEKADELARTNQYKSEFLANMSHELRTPLNSALILARLLADNKDGNLLPEQVKYASSIYASGNDLLILINDILDLSRIEAGRMEPHIEPVGIKSAVDSLRRTFQPVAEQKKLSFEVEVAAGLPGTMISDGLRVQQILRNLLANAFKFTEAGKVSLHVSASAGQEIEFIVRDTGIGIPPEQQQVIFDAFRQANGTTNRRYGGTGLGLTISRELARRLGGDVTVESMSGRGSAFTLTLPLVFAMPLGEPEPLASLASQSPPANASTVRGPSPAPPLALPQEREQLQQTATVEDDRNVLKPTERSILIIEDDPVFASILRDLSREQHFQSLLATSAAEALRLAEQFLPSAVLLDIRLPDNSGLAVLEQLKRNPRTRHIPVHVVSVADDSQQALALGAIGYALKPVQREQLVDAIHKLEQRFEQKLRQVLVVESVAEQRETILHLLSAENVHIVPVGTGGEALQRLKDVTFDCMILDLNLPDMSGYDLLDVLAAGKAFSFPPVIVYTAAGLGRADEDRLRRYASSIIVKGAKSPERLLDEVTLFLHQVEGKLPAEQQRILREMRSREAVLDGRNLLVADDDARSVFALASVLESKGAKVQLARNGKEAVAAVEAARAPGSPRLDLVLMDIMMPEMDGLTATREIRKHPDSKDIPIIALTAKAMPKDRDECLGAGADDYLAKPFDIDKLLSLIKVWMPR